MHKLQNQERLHFGNKLRHNHVNYSNQKMKVRLATQLFSDSVADALDFALNVLKLPQFKGSETNHKIYSKYQQMF